MKYTASSQTSVKLTRRPTHWYLSPSKHLKHRLFILHG